MKNFFEGGTTKVLGAAKAQKKKKMMATTKKNSTDLVARSVSSTEVIPIYEHTQFLLASHGKAASGQVATKQTTRRSSTLIVPHGAYSVTRSLQGTYTIDLSRTVQAKNMSASNKTMAQKKKKKKKTTTKKKQPGQSARMSRALRRKLAAVWVGL
jgi:hypothetical protein